MTTAEIAEAPHSTATDSASDTALVAEALAGPAGLAAIYDRYADRLHDFCVGMLRDRDAGADCVQDVFVTVATRLPQLREPDKLRAWLYAIARHQAHARLRSREDSTDEVPDTASPDTSPDVRAGRHELADLITHAAGGLSERERTVLELHYRHGLDGPELADALGVSHSNANTLVGRLRSTVERSLGALLVARSARRGHHCPELAAVLAGWDGAFTVLWRKRIARHIDQCSSCARQQTDLVNPRALLGAVPILVPAPVWLRHRLVAQFSALPGAIAAPVSPSAGLPNPAASAPGGWSARPAGPGPSRGRGAGRSAATDHGQRSWWPPAQPDSRRQRRRWLLAATGTGAVLFSLFAALAPEATNATDTRTLTSPDAPGPGAGNTRPGQPVTSIPAAPAAQAGLPAAAEAGLLHIGAAIGLPVQRTVTATPRTAAPRVAARGAESTPVPAVPARPEISAAAPAPAPTPAPPMALTFGPRARAVYLPGGPAQVAAPLIPQPRQALPRTAHPAGASRIPVREPEFGSRCSTGTGLTDTSSAASGGQRLELPEPSGGSTCTTTTANDGLPEGSAGTKVCADTEKGIGCSTDTGPAANPASGTAATSTSCHLTENVNQTCVPGDSTATPVGGSAGSMTAGYEQRPSTTGAGGTTNTPSKLDD